MFMRVGGGIFTKAADVGADLVGKVEQGIPEDDPRNAATIADNVGDNVGDCAGMAADLFESYAVTLVAALILGRVAFGTEGLVFPLIVPTIGVLTAIVGVFITRLRKSDKNGLTAINRAFYISALISAVLVAIAAWAYLPDSFAGLDLVEGSALANSNQDPRIVAIVAVVIGIVLAAVIQALTGYFTETERRPVQDIGKTSLTGPATVVLAGISVGLESAVYSAIVIGAGVYGAYLLGGGSIILSLFAVALAGTGLLTTIGVVVAMDTFGPISDNAQGIAEMSGDIDERGARTLTDLDAVGNTTKAITKGIAIATAVLAATALFGSYTTSLETALTERFTDENVQNVAAGRHGRDRSACSTSPTRATWSACCSARRWCSCSPAWPSTRCRARPAPSCSRSAASSASCPGSWTTASGRSTARSSTSAPATPSANWSLRVCWRSWHRSRSASASASARWPATWPGRSVPAR